MDKTEELRRCPFCGSKAILENLAQPQHERRIAAGCSNENCFAYLPSVYFAREADAIAAWNRRSSDEQAEVVGWQVREKSTQWDDCEWTEWRQASDDFAQRLIRDGGKVDDFRIAEVRPVYASPPAVAAGGVTVTDAMVEDALREWLDWPQGQGMFGHPQLVRMRAALSAALAVSEKK